MKESILGWVASLLYNAFNTLCNLGQNVSEIVRGIDGDTQLSNISTLVHQSVRDYAIPALQGIGYAVALLFFILALIELVRNERMTMEMFIKFFINLFVAIFFIYQSPNLYMAVIELGDGLGELCTNVFRDAGVWEIPSPTKLTELFVYYSELPKEDPRYMNWIAAMLLGIVAAAPVYLITLIMTAVTYVIAFTRLIELSVRGAFLPIGFSLLSDDGFKGAGGRYFRKFIAICAQVAALVMIAQITTLIIGAVGNNILTESILSTGADAPSFFTLIGQIVIVLGAAFGCISVMFKSIGLINDVFGA